MPFGSAQWKCQPQDTMNFTNHTRILNLKGKIVTLIPGV